MARHQEQRHSSSPRTVISTTPLYIPLAIALLTPSPFCVTCLSRLVIEYCRQRYLCTLVIIDLHLPLHTYHIILVSYWYYHNCVTRLFPHIHNCYLGLFISHSGHTEKNKKQ